MVQENFKLSVVFVSIYFSYTEYIEKTKIDCNNFKIGRDILSTKQFCRFSFKKSKNFITYQNALHSFVLQQKSGIAYFALNSETKMSTNFILLMLFDALVGQI